MDQRGGISLPVVLAIVLGFGLGASVYLNVFQHQRAAQERKLMQGEITDLRYQVKKDAEAKSASATPSPEPVATPEATPAPSAAPTPTPAPQVAGASAQTKVVSIAATL